MASYDPPVSRLVALGRPEIGPQKWADYSAFGIGPEHVPDLLRLLQDRELSQAREDVPSVYAQIHAWRALALLRAEAAIEPLLDLLAAQEADDDWDDWVTEGVPHALGMIGQPAFEPAATRLEQSRTLEHAPTYYAEVLAEIARQYPELRAAAVARLIAFLSPPTRNDPSVNGFVIGDLVDLGATEAWPVIEAAFVVGAVDESIGGDAAYVKHNLGLGPPPPQRRRLLPWGTTGRTAKERAEQRARKKKAEKRRKKKRH